MKHLALLVLFATLPSALIAKDWPTRPTDQPLAQAELDKLIRGRVLTYYDGGTSDFRPDGQYFYTYGGGGTWEGEFVVGADSAICVTYVTGSTRCDLYVMAGERLTVITEDGLRFPVKEIATR